MPWKSFRLIKRLVGIHLLLAGNIIHFESHRLKRNTTNLTDIDPIDRIWILFRSNCLSRTDCCCEITNYWEIDYFTITVRLLRMLRTSIDNLRSLWMEHRSEINKTKIRRFLEMNSDLNIKTIDIPLTGNLSATIFDLPTCTINQLTFTKDNQDSNRSIQLVEIRSIWSMVSTLIKRKVVIDVIY